MIKHKLTTTLKELRKLKPCQPALDFIAKEGKGRIKVAWNKCQNISWMIWYLFNTKQATKDDFAFLAKECAEHISHLKNSYANAAYANAAADAAYAAYAANAAAYAANAAADAANAAAAYAANAAEKKWQCDKIREFFNY